MVVHPIRPDAGTERNVSTVVQYAPNIDVVFPLDIERRMLD